jgi:hypothetical protein
MSKLRTKSEMNSSVSKDIHTNLPSTNALKGRLPDTIESALIEYAKQLITKSVETSLEFHKTMLSVSATFGSAITTLVPILIWGDKDAKLPTGPGWLILVPALLMLISSVCFALGYYPRHSKLNVNDLSAVRAEKDNLLRKRAFLGAIGLGVFCASLLLLVGLVLFLREK